MLDARDRETLAFWAIRGVAATVGVLGAAVILGLAVRLFFYIAGVT